MSKRRHKPSERRPEPSWRWRVGRAVEIVVNTSSTPPYLMKETVIKAVREAIDLSIPSDQMIRDAPVESLPPGVPDDYHMTMAGVFRTVLMEVPNWRSDLGRETFMAEVQRALDAELGMVRVGI